MRSLKMQGGPGTYNDRNSGFSYAIRLVCATSYVRTLSAKRFALLLGVSVATVRGWRSVASGSPLDRVGEQIAALELAGYSSAPLLRGLLQIRREARAIRKGE